MNSVAFAIISIFMLAAALAAATLRTLMHAALSFALAFVGVAMFSCYSVQSLLAWCWCSFTSAQWRY